MHKTPRLESLETRTLLAGLDGGEDLSGDSEAIHVGDDSLEIRIKVSKEVQQSFYEFALFSGIIVGTAIFVAVGIYFGERV